MSGVNPLLPQDPAPVLERSGEMDYIVLTTSMVKHYSFDGTQMQENTLLNASWVSNQLALASRGTYPDVLVADSANAAHR